MADDLASELEELQKKYQALRVVANQTTSKRILVHLMSEMLPLTPSFAKQSDNRYILLDMQKNAYPIVDDVDDILDRLMFGTVPFIVYDHAGDVGKITVHPRIVDDGLPLIVFTTQKAIFAVQRQTSADRSKITIKTSSFTQGLSLKDVSRSNINRDYATYHDDDTLAKLAAKWLCVSDQDVEATLIVDGNEIIAFLECAEAHPNSLCHFSVCGDGLMVAYIHLKDVSNMTQYVLTVGTVQKK